MIKKISYAASCVFRWHPSTKKWRISDSLDDSTVCYASVADDAATPAQASAPWSVANLVARKMETTAGEVHPPARVANHALSNDVST